MRFAWIKKNTPGWVTVERGPVSKLVFTAYNIIYWIPFLLPFTPAIEYRTGFIWFFAFIVFRALVNVYRINFMKPEQAENFPLRAV